MMMMMTVTIAMIMEMMIFILEMIICDIDYDDYFDYSGYHKKR